MKIFAPAITREDDRYLPRTTGLTICGAEAQREDNRSVVRCTRGPEHLGDHAAHYGIGGRWMFATWTEDGEP